jgi:fido (protein-threonine AMPylation protein)
MSFHCPHLIRLPFIEKEPTEIWNNCVQKLDKWNSVSNEYRIQKEKFASNALPQLIWEINHLEGTLPGDCKTPEDFSLQHPQLLQHLAAFKYMLSSLSGPLTEDLIKTTHGIMMKDLSNEQGFKINAGMYRQISVFAGDHVYPTHTCIPRCMTDIVERYNMKMSEADHDPYQLASWIYFEVVSLHPFEDGNGRLSRLLWCYSLMKDGLPFPATLNSGHKKSQKHLVRCIQRDQDCFYTDNPHLTTLTVVSVHQAWEQYFQSLKVY